MDYDIALNVAIEAECPKCHWVGEMPGRISKGVAAEIYRVLSNRDADATRENSNTAIKVFLDCKGCNRTGSVTIQLSQLPYPDFLNIIERALK